LIWLNLAGIGALDHTSLRIDGAADGFDHAGKLRKQTVARVDFHRDPRGPETGRTAREHGRE
jgi:hypothetical protein